MNVTWNGRPLPVHPARVSAFPLNKVWDGAQRPVEQSAPAAFVSFDMDAPGELRVTMAPSPQQTALPPPCVLLPLGSAPEWRWEDGVLVVNVDRPRQFSICLQGGDAAHGVVRSGDGAHAIAHSSDGGGAAATPAAILHVFANPPFALPSPASCGRTLRFGPGEHLAGVIVPESGDTIVIEEGAIVHGAVLVANAHDVRIVGRGILDGSYLDRADHGSAAYRAAIAAGISPGFYGAEMAVTCLTIWNSSNVRIEGVVLRDPPRWALIARAQSRDVQIDNVKIVGCWRYNADGIDVCASENVAIRDSFVQSFDDCIVARGAYLDGDGPVTRGVTAERCVLWCDWGKCLEVWAGPYPCLIEGVRFRDIAAVHPSGTVCDVTTWFASSDTRIRDVAFEDIEVDFALPLLRERLQTAPEDGAVEPPLRTVQRLLVVNCERYGHYLGNQKHVPATDLSGFRVRYEDIAFRRIRCLGDVPELVGLIDAKTSPHTIDGVVTEELPTALRLEIAGNVRGGDGAHAIAHPSDGGGAIATPNVVNNPSQHPKP